MIFQVEVKILSNPEFNHGASTQLPMVEGPRPQVLSQARFRQEGGNRS